MQVLTISGRLAGMNELTDANRGRFGSNGGNRLKRANQEEIAICIGQQGLVPCEGCKDFGFVWFEKSRNRDKDNVSAGGHKFIFDALKEAGIIANDGWRYVGDIADLWFCDPENPRIEVYIFDREVNEWNENPRPRLTDLRGIVLQRLGLAQC